MKKLIALVVLLVLLVVADRVAVGVAENQLADRVQSSQDLPSKPTADISGFPFLTQVIGGRYEQVTLSLPAIEREGLRLSQVDIRADGVRVALGDVIGGRVSSVPIDHARGDVLLTYDDLDAYLVQRVEVPKVTVKRDGQDVKVTGTVEIPLINRPVSVSGNAAVDVSGDEVTIRPTAVQALTGFLPGIAQAPAREALTVRFTIKGLPLGVRLDGATLTDEGIRFTALADGVTLDAGSARG
jgi:hypothetical protein